MLSFTDFFTCNLVNSTPIFLKIVGQNETIFLKCPKDKFFWGKVLQNFAKVIFFILV